MAKPVIPPKVKLFIGVLFNHEGYLLEVEEKLKKKFGDIDLQSNYISFAHTDYYNEIGRDIHKVFYSFKKLIKRESIADIKLFTNRLEEKISEKGRRKVNIDPGYLTLSNVFLATCKDYFHRTYLTKGIYLENEYKYVGKEYHPWEWTYPDYRKREYLFFFHDLRNIYHKQLNK